MKTERIFLCPDAPTAYLDTYIADNVHNDKRHAILVIPGGGYHDVCSQREGEPIALAFLARGYQAFVLHYSVAGESARTFPSQLIEASLAMKHIKDHAREYRIDPERVFVTGFSAGGHLAGSLGILWHLPAVTEGADIPYGYNKPCGMMLIYPVISADPAFAHTPSHQHLWGKHTLSDEEMLASSLEKHVDDRSVPLFLMHTSDDTVVPVRNALALATAYAERSMPFEMHIHPHGPHGMALGNEITRCGNEKLVDDAWAAWIDRAVSWAKALS